MDSQQVSLFPSTLMSILSQELSSKYRTWLGYSSA